MVHDKISVKDEKQRLVDTAIDIIRESKALSKSAKKKKEKSLLNLLIRVTRKEVKARK